jgi:hypothetical protein
MSASIASLPGKLPGALGPGWILQVLALLWIFGFASPARAIGPYCTSAGSPVSTCSFTVAANQLIVVDYFNTSNAVTLTSGLGLTYKQVRCDQETTVGNPAYGCHVYAKTGSTSGSETITLGSASWLWVQVLSSSDVQTTATNPVDTTLSFERNLTSCGATCYTMSAGNITTTAPNDFIDYISLMANCSNFYASPAAPTVGTVTLIAEIENSGQNSGAIASGGCWV